MALVDGVTFSREFDEKGPQRGRCGWWVVEFLTKVEVELDPFMVFGAFRGWHAASIEPALEISHQFCGKLLHVHWEKGSVAPRARRLFPVVNK